MKKALEYLETHTIVRFIFVVLLLSASAAIVYAAVPHTFTAGTAAKSSEVNENFEYLDAKALSCEYVSGTGTLSCSNGYTLTGFTAPNSGTISASSTGAITSPSFLVSAGHEYN